MTRPVTSNVLVGRREELTLLDGLLGSLVSDHSGGCLLIAGEAGVGKSRLIEAMAELADERQVQLFIGHCVQFGEEKLPAAPLVEILGDLTVALTDEELELVIGPARDELAGLVPALGSRPSAERPLEASHLLELVHGVLTRLAARGPVVLAIEDLHWADRTTRDLIGFLALRLRNDPVLLVATYRSDDLHRRHPLLPSLAELQRSARPERIELAPFDTETTAELIVAIGGYDVDPAALEAMQRRSGGNAFFVEELLVGAGSGRQVPPTLREVVLSRTLGLDDDAMSIIRIASAVGSRIDEDLLERVADLDRARISAALRQLLDGHFLVRDDTHIHFRHELTREVFADELLPGERTDLHERIAVVLQDLEPARLGEIAHHWYQSGNQPEALRTALTAGEAANRSGATAEALLHFERALELWDRVPEPARRTDLSHTDLLLLAAAAADLLQEFRRSTELGRQACDELAIGDDLTRALALVQLSEWLWHSGEPGIDEAVDLALQLIEGEPASADVATVLARAGRSDMMAGRIEESFERCQAALEMARATGNRKVESNVRNTIALCRHTLGLPGAIAEMRAATELAIEIDDTDEVNRGFVNLSELLYLDGRHEEAIAVAFEGLHYSEEHAFGGVCDALLAENASYCLATLGRWDEVDALSERIMTIRPLDLDVPAPTGLSAMAGVMVKRGETDRARPLLEHDLQAELTDFYCGESGAMICGLLEIALIEGRPTPDGDLMESAIDLLSGKKDDALVQVMAVALRGEADAATTAGHLGDESLVVAARESSDRWMQLAEDALPNGPERPAAAVFDLLVAQCRAEHGRAHGRNDPDAWARVAAGWERLGRPWPTAYSQWRHAEAILIADRRQPDGRGVAQHLLSEAHVVAIRLGAKPLLADIEDLATRARINLVTDSDRRVRDAGSGGAEAPFDLTPRELEVLQLVAQGHSNGRIGKELFISTKTASVHVSNILRKLGAANRIEAAAMANAAGIAGSAADSDLELTGQ